VAGRSVQKVKRVLPLPPDKVEAKAKVRAGRAPRGIKKAEFVQARVAKGGRASRQKGDRFERECVNVLNASGIFTERVPLSGAAGGSFSGDLEVILGGKRRKVECKMRKRAWKDLYAWLQENYALFIRANQEQSLVVLRLSDFIDQHKTEW